MIRLADANIKLEGTFMFDAQIKLNSTDHHSQAISGQRGPRSDCAVVQSDLGLRCPLTAESMNTKNYMDTANRDPGWTGECAD